MNVTFSKEHFMRTKPMVLAILGACVTCDAMAMLFQTDWPILTEEKYRLRCGQTGECDGGSLRITGQDFTAFLTAIDPMTGIVRLVSYLIPR
jgi:hypothetical protein